MVLASNYDQSRFLKAEDVPVPKKVRIKDVTEEMVGTGNDQEKKLVVWFTNLPKGLVCNKTNNRVLRGAFGDETTGWKDMVVVVFSTMVDFRGQMKNALRVRMPTPKQPTAAAPAATPQPPPSGNGAAGAAMVKPQAAPVADPDLADDQPMPIADEMDDGVPF